MTIHGFVHDHEGKPIADARVAVLEAPMPIPDVALIADVNGSFVIGTTQPGRYRISVHADGYQGAEAVVVVRGDSSPLVRIQLEADR